MNRKNKNATFKCKITKMNYRIMKVFWIQILVVKSESELKNHCCAQYLEALQMQCFQEDINLLKLMEEFLLIEIHQYLNLLFHILEAILRFLKQMIKILTNYSYKNQIFGSLIQPEKLLKMRKKNKKWLKIYSHILKKNHTQISIK